MYECISVGSENELKNPKTYPYIEALRIIDSLVLLFQTKKCNQIENRAGTNK